LSDSPFIIAGRTFSSRLIIGTGKYPSHAVMARAHDASGADMVTVAVRRVNISDRSQESLLDYIDTDRMFILPNTAGCYTADEAIRTARLGREAGLTIVLVSHDLGFAAELCDRLLLMAEGAAVRVGPPESVIDEAVLESAYGCRVLVDKHPISRRPTIHLVYPTS